MVNDPVTRWIVNYFIMMACAASCAFGWYTCHTQCEELKADHKKLRLEYQNYVANHPDFSKSYP